MTTPIRIQMDANGATIHIDGLAESPLRHHQIHRNIPTGTEQIRRPRPHYQLKRLILPPPATHIAIPPLSCNLPPLNARFRGS